MNAQKLTEEQKDIVAENHCDKTKEKLTQEALGQMFEVSPRTIYRALLERGCVAPKAYQAKKAKPSETVKVTPTHVYLPMPITMIEPPKPRTHPYVPEAVSTFINKLDIRDLMYVLRLRRHAQRDGVQESA